MRLTPLKDVLASLNTVKSVASNPAAIADSLGNTLAMDVFAPETLPSRARALYDGFAVLAEATLDASAYAPIVLKKSVSIISGAPMPGSADAIAKIDAVEVGAEAVELTSPVAAGEGVLEKGGDCAAGALLRRAGCRVHAGDIAIFRFAGVSELLTRCPMISIGCARESAAIDIIAKMVADELRIQGAQSNITMLEHALIDDQADAVIGIGGTGGGANDHSAELLSRAGRVVFHGVGFMPGETSAFGFAGEKPVLLIPGRFDAALAVWHVLGQRFLARLCGNIEDLPSLVTTLARKVSSPPGIAEFVPLRIVEGKAQPLAAKYLPLESLAVADGWILVPAESEGYRANTSVRMRPWR